MTRRLATWLPAMFAGVLLVASLSRGAVAIAPDESMKAPFTETTLQITPDYNVLRDQIGLVRDRSNVRFQVEYVL